MSKQVSNEVFISAINDNTLDRLLDVLIYGKAENIDGFPMFYNVKSKCWYAYDVVNNRHLHFDKEDEENFFEIFDDDIYLVCSVCTHCLGEIFDKMSAKYMQKYINALLISHKGKITKSDIKRFSEQEYMNLAQKYWRKEIKKYLVDLITE